MMSFRDEFHKINLAAGLFLHLHYRYRVEIEEYHTETWSARSMRFHYFKTFPEAKTFIRNYPRPFYLIRLYEQQRIGFTLCNIDTGAPADNEQFDYERDEFGFLLPVKLSAGWYVRGENTHHPMFMKVTRDLGRMEKEAVYRYMMNRSNPFNSLRKIADDVFEERHPGAPAHFKRNFFILLVNKMNKSPNGTRVG
jgi:hypothetical protein